MTTSTGTFKEDTMDDMEKICEHCGCKLQCHGTCDFDGTERVYELEETLRRTRELLDIDTVGRAEALAKVAELEADLQRTITTRDDAVRALGACEKELEIIGKMSAEAGDIFSYYMDQIDWSERTFGPGERTLGILKHLAKELKEVEAKPDDLEEWIDLVVLAMDGYWRHGGTPASFMQDLLAKQVKNFSRQWPPPGPEDEAIEHIRGDVP